MANNYLRQIRASQQTAYTESLFDYIPRVTPRWTRPVWLTPYVELLEQVARGEPVHAVVAAPPQHGKTETSIHALCWLLRKRPGKRSAYATYAQERSERMSDKARIVAENDRIDMRFRREFWSDPQTGGSILWTSDGGPFTGEAVDGLLLIDDITKDRIDANSAIKRGQKLDWFDDVAEPRCHPGSSIIVMATRWHPDDLSGMLIKRGWPYINLKALADGPANQDGVVVGDPLGRKLGEPLCPERKPQADLEAKRRTNIYSFASLYQGEPRPRGGTVFSEPTYYTDLPDSYSVAYGVDLAVTAKTSADFSVCIRLYRSGDDYYVVDVVRKQVDAPSFTLTLRARQSEERGPMLWHVGGTEKGTAQFITQKISEFRTKPATVDKFQRATPVAEAWNNGHVMVPKDAPWLDEFLDEVLNFTGVNDSHDDQVDALASGFAAFHRSRPRDLGVGGVKSDRR